MSGAKTMCSYLDQQSVLFSDRLPHTGDGLMGISVRLQHHLLPVSCRDLQRLLPQTHRKDVKYLHGRAAISMTTYKTVITLMHWHGTGQAASVSMCCILAGVLQHSTSGGWPSGSSIH